MRARRYGHKDTADADDQAAELYQMAIDRDPRFALAYLGLAEVLLSNISGRETPVEHVAERVREYSLRAAAQPGLPEIESTKGWLAFERGALPEAVAHLKAAIARNPNCDQPLTARYRLRAARAAARRTRSANACRRTRSARFHRADVHVHPATGARKIRRSGPRLAPAPANWRPTMPGARSSRAGSRWARQPAGGDSLDDRGKQARAFERLHRHLPDRSPAHAAPH